MIADVIFVSFAESNAFIHPATSIYVEAFNSSVFCGEFLQLTNGIVGRLLDVSDDESAILVLHCSVPPNGVTVPPSGIADMIERVAECFATWELVESILEIYFVFPACSILRYEFFPNGMENAAFLRYFKREDGTLDVISDEEMNNGDPFPSSGPYPYSQTIFDFLTRAQIASKTALSTKRMYEYKSKNSNLDFVSRPCWDYIVRRFHYLLANNPQGTSRPFKRSRRFQTPQLSVSVFESKNSLSFIRIVSESEMTACRQIFGGTFAIGTKISAPPLAARKAAAPLALFTMLAYDDMVRIVTCPAVSNYNQRTRFRMNINDRGCDFTFDARLRVFSLKLRFDELLGSNTLVAPFVVFPAHPVSSTLSAGCYITDRQNKVVYKIIGPGEGTNLIVQNVVTLCESTMTRDHAIMLARTVE